MIRTSVPVPGRIAQQKNPDRPTCREIAVKALGPPRVALEPEERARRQLPPEQKELRPADLVEAQKSDLALLRLHEGALVRPERRGKVRLEAEE